MYKGFETFVLFLSITSHIKNNANMVTYPSHVNGSHYEPSALHLLESDQVCGVQYQVYSVWVLSHVGKEDYHDLYSEISFHIATLSERVMPFIQSILL